MHARHLRLHETEVLIHKRDMPAVNVAARELARVAFEKPGQASAAAAEVQNVAVFGKRPRTVCMRSTGGNTQAYSRSSGRSKIPVRLSQSHCSIGIRQPSR